MIFPDYTFISHIKLVPKVFQVYLLIKYFISIFLYYIHKNYLKNFVDLILEKVSYDQKNSLIARWNRNWYFSTPLHFHIEYELVYVVESYGIRYVGDSKEPFREDDLVLVGSQLPHTWQNDEIFTRNLKSHIVKAVIIQFGHDFVNMINQCHEFYQVGELIKESQRGLSFTTESCNEVKNMLLQLPDIPDHFEKVLLVLRILNQLAKSKNYRHLASLSFQNMNKEQSITKIIDTIKHISVNYQDKLTLSEIANRFSMSTTAFCNYFKRKTGKTLICYINEIRISQACRLLISSEKNITEIAFECGFNNISNFNRIFKSITGKTPREYRLIWITSISKNV